MGKKKRIRRMSVYASIEGEKTEVALFSILKNIYLDKTKISLEDKPVGGGNPNRIIGFAISNSDRKRSFTWVDEDKPINQETRNCLFKHWNVSEDKRKEFNSCLLRDLQSNYNTRLKNPVLVVSQPVCVESMILKILDINCPCNVFDEGEREKQIGDLKSALSGKTKNKSLLDCLKDNVTKEVLEQKRTEIEELDLLIKMISVD